MRRLLRDIVAVIFAVGISGSMLILSIGELFHDGHITDSEAVTISTILGAGVGALATYLGGKSRKGDDDDNDSDTDV